MTPFATRRRSHSTTTTRQRASTVEATVGSIRSWTVARAILCVVPARLGGVIYFVGAQIIRLLHLFLFLFFVTSLSFLFLGGTYLNGLFFIFRGVRFLRAGSVFVAMAR